MMGNIYENLLQFKGTWREYQDRVLTNSQKYLADRKLHIVAAPGSGKTTLGIELIRRLGEPCLILSPSITIRQQWLERITEGFLADGCSPETILSNDLKNMKMITAVTYQALYSAVKHYEGALEDQEESGEESAGDPETSETVDFRDFDFFKAVKGAGIRTICLDEAHHLRSEWWKALETFMKEMDGATVIALTATPPYDSTPNQWKRYIDLCGPIDEEISTPELVREGSLCPHEDYVYFNWPAGDELREIEEYQKKTAKVRDELLADREFARMVASHKGLADPEGYSEVVYYIHPQTGILYFHRHPNKLVKYNQDGEFLGETIQPKSLLQGFCAAFADSLIIGHYGGGIGTSPFESKLIYSNEEGKATDSISNFSRNIPTITPNDIASISVFKGGSGKEAFGMLGYNGLIYITYKDNKKGIFPLNHPTIWNSGDALHFKEALKDTIYTINGNTMQPYLTFNTGKWTFPADKIGETEGTQEYITISYVMETPQSILFQCIQGIYSRSVTFTGIYNKATGTTYMNKDEAGFTDDLSRFMPFFPETSSQQGEYASVLEIGDIQEWLDEHPETVKEGKLNFLKKINEDSNPVCVIVEP